MINLLELITTKLKEVNSRVYLEQAPERTEFPYLVYTLPNSTEQEQREDFILAITVWDDSNDTVILETLADNVDKKINRLKYIDGNIQVCFYRINRLMLTDPNPNIRRRELRYQAKTYFI